MLTTKKNHNIYVELQKVDQIYVEIVETQVKLHD